MPRPYNRRTPPGSLCASCRDRPPRAPGLVLCQPCRDLADQVDPYCLPHRSVAIAVPGPWDLGPFVTGAGPSA